MSLSRACRHILTAVGALLLARIAVAQGPVIDHPGVSCVMADRFPQLDAAVGDPDAVARIRVYFRGGSASAWYFVDMKRSGPVFSGVLPKPTRSLESMSYYIEASDRQFREGRTQIF